LLVHGSPRKINEYLFEDRDEKSMMRIMEGADADIMCFGHTHKPYHRILPIEPGEHLHYRHAINIGSVGKPKDNNPKGCYVIVTINADSSITNKNAIQVEFIRFDYDVEKAAKQLRKVLYPTNTQICCGRVIKPLCNPASNIILSLTKHSIYLCTL